MSNKIVVIKMMIGLSGDARVATCVSRGNSAKKTTYSKQTRSMSSHCLLRMLSMRQLAVPCYKGWPKTWTVDLDRLIPGIAL